MPLRGDELVIGLACGRDLEAGRGRCWYDIRIEPDALRRLGLHPGQPTSKIVGPSPPLWWHAAAERAAGASLRFPPRPRD
ncbi:hypothetical protein [Actinomadura algeriensis]|uniref:Ferrous iron transport protein A n=1 Tax=Actinomadura algeriensis TaxID=1679523 RepID=A0ABR9K389_9ACTN|nr:hypothetical protein [Actinomadura algeriensis]MBE1537163.1 hypothetical protein [Actinomadura algeriensis]